MIFQLFAQYYSNTCICLIGQWQYFLEKKNHIQGIFYYHYKYQLKSEKNFTFF